jgi:spermidine/putrescine transport system permease protein
MDGLLVILGLIAVVVVTTLMLARHAQRGARSMEQARRRGEIEYGEQLTARDHVIRSVITSGPGIAWVSFFLLVPLLVMGAISFVTKNSLKEYQATGNIEAFQAREIKGEMKSAFTLDNYKRFFGHGRLGYNPLYPKILGRSFMLALGTTVFCVICAFPLAFFIAAMPDKYKGLALTLAVIPFWTNLLIRTYAWQLLLAPESFITRFMNVLGVGAPGAPLYPSPGAVFIGMISAYLPFLILPLYTAVEKIDWSIAEAASDLGADGRRVFWYAVLPQVIPGLAAGVTLVFIPAMGQYVVPDLLGGAKTVMLGNAIQQQFGPSLDWPFGSAIAFLSMGAVMLALWIYARNAARRGVEALL